LHPEDHVDKASAAATQLCKAFGIRKQSASLQRFSSLDNSRERVPQRNAHDQIAIHEEQVIAGYNERLRSPANHLGDRILELAGRGDFDEHRLDAERPACLLELFAHGAIMRVGRIQSYADLS